jgi:hypothetical protein
MAGPHLLGASGHGVQAEHLFRERLNFASVAWILLPVLQGNLESIA